MTNPTLEAAPVSPQAKHPASDAPELLLSRVFDAPPELVFAAWTQPQHLTKWCAPHGFSIAECDGDLQPGGAWHTLMLAPDGTTHRAFGTYHEVSPHERLVFTHAWDEEGTSPHETLVTLELSPEGRGTRMSFRQQFFASASSRDGHEDGWDQSFERLEATLAKRNALQVAPRGEREIVMSRSFKAPQRLVWEAITKPAHVRHWWGAPMGTMPSCEMDFRVGGAWRYTCEGKDGELHGFRGEYREISPIERIVQTFEWEGLPGHISIETLTLSERDGHTTMDIVSVFDSLEDRDGMLYSGMEEGAGLSYDRLEALLEQLAAESATA